MPNQNARYAAIVAFGQKAGKRLDDGLCPRCGKPAQQFRDCTSEREYEISGLCQKCQDVIFAED
jgi:predicted amidophosphoribosyltransferase